MASTALAIKKADDLFDKSTMSFGSHLEELRKCLIYAMIWIAAGLCIGLFFAKDVVNYVQTPLENELAVFYAKKAAALVKSKSGGMLSEADQQYLIDHDLSASLIYTVPAEPVVEESTSELSNAVVRSDPALEKYIPLNLKDMKPQWIIEGMPTKTDALGLQEPFMIWFKAGLVVGIVIASPGIFYSIWTFIAAGLYPHERKYVYFFLPAAIFLFLAGAAFAFFIIFQIVIRFLLTFNESLGIGASPRLTDYMSFALFLPLGFGAAFQLPLVMFVLERIGLISVNTYKSQWRIAILVISIVAMIIAPEVTSMIGMGIPLIGLYYLGIALCIYFPRRGFQAEPGYDPQ
jgi:sec-independent protein translocase protein TatC